jgi:hypothetical protein
MISINMVTENMERRTSMEEWENTFTKQLGENYE